MITLAIPILALLLTLLGLFLLVTGMRGRVVNARILCRRCAFDLTGAPGIIELLAPETPTPARCPECGSTLATGADLRLGRRQRRPSRAFFACVILLFALPGVALPLVSTLLGPATLSKLPDSLLELQALYAPGNARLAAIDDLLARLQKGGWSSTGLAKVADDVLRTSDAAGSIPASLHPLLREAFQRQAPSPEAAMGWLSKRFTLNATANSKVSQDRLLAVRIRATPTASNQSEGFHMFATLVLETASLVAIDGEGVEHDCGPVLRGTTCQVTNQGHAYAELRAGLSLKPGTYTLRASIPYRLRPERPGNAGARASHAPGVVTLDTPCTVFPPDIPVVKLNADPEIVRAYRESLTRAKIVALRAQNSRGSLPSRGMLFLKSDRPVPCDGYFKVTVEPIDAPGSLNGPAPTVQPLHISSRARSTGSAWCNFPSGFEPKSVRVTLTPDHMNAELNCDTLRLSEIVDGEIVLECVPVEWRTEGNLGSMFNPGDF